MLAKNPGEAPDFVKSVVERRRRDADDVRLAEIAFHARGLEFLKQLFRMFVDKNRELRAMFVRLTRSDDGEKLGWRAVEQELRGNR